MFSGVPRHSGTRVYGAASTALTISSGGSSALTVTMSVRWTITSETSSSPKRKTFWMYSAWLSSILPCSAETSTSPSISTSVRISWCDASRDAEAAQDGARRRVEQPVQRIEEHEGDVQRIGDPQRHRLGLADRQGLRHLLADHDVQRREDQEADQERGEMQRRLGHAERREHRLEQCRHGRLADPAEAERGHGDAELAAGEIGFDVAAASLARGARRSGLLRPARRCGSRGS